MLGRRPTIPPRLRAPYRRKKDPLLFNMLLSTTLSIVLNAYFGKPVFHSSMLSVGLHLWADEIVEEAQPGELYAQLEPISEWTAYADLRRRIQDL